MLSTSGRTSRNSLSTNPNSHWLQSSITYDADPVLNCSRGPKQLLVNVFWRLLLLCATDCLPNRVLAHWLQSSLHHMYCWSCLKCSRGTLHLLVVTCLLKSVAAFVIWRTALSCFPKLLISVSTSHNSLFLSHHESYLTRVTKVLSSSQQQSNR